MAEFPTFKEQQLFTGVKYAQGFKPEKAPDYTTGLRAEAESSLKNLDAKEKQLQAQDAIQVNREIQNLEALRQFSPTIGRMIELGASAYIDAQYIAAQDDIRKIGALNNYGITDDEIASRQADIDQWREASQISGEASIQQIKAGGTTEQVNYIKGIAAGSWRRYHVENFYVGQQTKGVASRWQQYQAKNQNRQYKDRFGNSFALKDVGTDQHRAANVFAHFARTDLTNMGISQNFNPDKITMKPYYDMVNGVGQSYITAIQNANTVETATNLRREYIASFLDKDTNGEYSLSALHANYRGLTILNKEGKMVTLDNRQALQVALGDITDLVQAGEMSHSQAVALANEVAAHAPKGQTYGIYHRDILNDFKDDLNTIRTKKFNQLQLGEREANFKVKKVSEDFVSECQKTGTCTVADYRQARQRLQALRPGADFSALDNAIVQTSQRTNDEYYAQSFKEAADNFQLSAQAVNQASASPELKAQYMQIARDQDAERAKFTVSDSDLNTVLDEALRTSLGSTNLDELKSGLRLARLHAKQRVNQVLKSQYDQTNTADQQNAINVVLDEIAKKDGKFIVYDPTTPGNPGHDPTKQGKFGTFFGEFVPKSAGGSLDAGVEYRPYAAPKELIEGLRANPVEFLKETSVTNSGERGLLIQDIEQGVVNPRVPDVLRALHANDPMGRELHEIVNQVLETEGHTQRMQPAIIDLASRQTTDQRLNRLLKEAVSDDEILRRTAAAGGAVTNVQRYGTPLLAQRMQDYIDEDGFERSFTGALTYKGNKKAYKDSYTMLQKAFGLVVKEHVDFGGVSPNIHAPKGYHPQNEAADFYVYTTEENEEADIRATGKVIYALRKLNLFKEILGPGLTTGSGDPGHTRHGHAGGLIRPLTMKDIEDMKVIIGGL
jgi:hypothetical protein